MLDKDSDSDSDSDKKGWCLLSRGSVAGTRATSGCFGDIAALSRWTGSLSNLATWHATQPKPLLHGTGGCTKLIQIMCDDLWRWVDSHQAMSGFGRCESPPNNKKLRDDESTIVDSQSCRSWFCFVFRARPSPSSGPRLQGRVGKVGTGTLSTARNGCARLSAGWCALLCCGCVREGAQTQAGAIPSIDPIDQAGHQPQRLLAPPTRAATYQSVRSTCRAFPRWTHPTV